MDKTASRIAKSAAAIIMISAISKFLGLVRESAVAAYFGAGGQTDAYRVAFDIPSILTGVIYAAIAVTFIPVYSEYKNKTSEERLYFVNNLFNIIVLITAMIAAFGMIFAPFLVSAVAPGFHDRTYDLAVNLTVMMFPSIVFLALAYLANGFLQFNRSFAIPASMGIPLSLIIILSIFFFHDYGIMALAVGSLIAMASQYFIQVPSMVKKGYRFLPVINFKDPGLKKVLVLAIPVFISTAFNEISILVDRMLASGLDHGSISVLDYAQKVNGIAGGIFFASLAIVFFPELSRVSDVLSKFGKTVTAGLNIVILIAFPVMAGLFILRVPIITLLFERGAFDSDSTAITAAVLGFFAIGIIGTGLTSILTRAFYSLKDTKTPMIMGILAICANIVFNLLFIGSLGVYGLALASSLASILCGLSLFFRIRKKVQVSFREIGILILKSAAATIVMGIIMYLLKNAGVGLFDDNGGSAGLLLKLLITGGIGLLAYIGMLYILKTKELVYFLNMIWSRFRSAKKLT